MEANKPEQEPSVMGDIENDDDSLSLNDKQVKFLKRQARKRKWVRRCRKCNDYLHAICKSHNKQTNKHILSLLTHLCYSVWMSAAAIVIYKTNFFKQLWENPEVNQFFLTLTLVLIGF